MSFNLEAKLDDETWLQICEVSQQREKEALQLNSDNEFKFMLMGESGKNINFVLRSKTT